MPGTDFVSMCRYQIKINIWTFTLGYDQEQQVCDHPVAQFEIPPIVNLAQDDLHSLQKFYKGNHVNKNIARIEFEVQSNSEVQIDFIFGSICLEIVTVGLNVRVQDGTEKANDVTTQDEKKD